MANNWVLLAVKWKMKPRLLRKSRKCGRSKCGNLLCLALSLRTNKASSCTILS